MTIKHRKTGNRTSRAVAKLRILQAVHDTKIAFALRRVEKFLLSHDYPLYTIDSTNEFVSVSHISFADERAALYPGMRDEAQVAFDVAVCMYGDAERVLTGLQFEAFANAFAHGKTVAACKPPVFDAPRQARFVEPPPMPRTRHDPRPISCGPKPCYDNSGTYVPFDEVVIDWSRVRLSAGLYATRAPTVSPASSTPTRRSRKRARLVVTPVDVSDDESWYIPTGVVSQPFVPPGRLARKKRAIIQPETVMHTIAQSGVTVPYWGLALGGTLATAQLVSLIMKGVRAYKDINFIVSGVSRTATIVSSLPTILRNLVGTVATAGAVVSVWNFVKHAMEHFRLSNEAIGLTAAGIIAALLLAKCCPCASSFVSAFQTVIGVPFGFKNDVLDDVSGYTVADAQSGDPWEFPLDPLLSLLVKVTTASMIGAKSFKKAPIESLTRFFREAHKTDIAVMRQSGFLEWVFDTMAGYISKFSQYFGGPEFRCAVSIAKSVGDWSRDVDLILERIRTVPYVATTTDHNALRGYEHSGRDFQKEYRLESREAQLVSKQLVALRAQLSSSLFSALANSGIRNEPFCFMLRGEPGTGKSFFINEVARLLSSYLNSGSIENALFVPTKGQDFYEGYNHQTVFAIDDWLQEKEAPCTNPCAVGLLISLVNMHPCPLNMAFEQKGKVFMDSPIIALTTNVREITIKAANFINDIGALKRRIKLMYELRPVARFRRSDGKFDHDGWLRYVKGADGAEPVPVITALSAFELTPIDLDGVPVHPCKVINGTQLTAYLADVASRVVLAPVLTPTKYEATREDVAAILADIDGELITAIGQSGGPFKRDHIGDATSDVVDYGPSILTRALTSLGLRGAFCAERTDDIVLSSYKDTEFYKAQIRYFGLDLFDLTLTITVYSGIVYVLSLAVKWLVGRLRAVVSTSYKFIFGHACAQSDELDETIPIDPRVGARNKVMRNMVEVYNGEPGQEKRLGMALHVGGTYIALPWHIGKELMITGGRFVRKENNGVMKNTRFPPGGLEFVGELPRKDLMLVRTPGHSWADITKLLATPAEREAACREGGLTMLRVEAGVPMIRESRPHVVTPVNGFLMSATLPGVGKQDYVRDGYKIVSPGLAGFCGGVWATSKPAFKVIGLHFAGDDTTGSSFANGLDMESLEKMGYVETRLVVPFAVKEPKFEALGDTSLRALAHGPAVASNTVSTKSLSRLGILAESGVPGKVYPWHRGLGLKPSKLRCFIPKTGPFAGSRIDPMAMAIKKFDGETCAVDAVRLKMALDTALADFYDYAKDMQRGTLPTDVAIFGDGLRYESLPANKSPGYIMKTWSNTESRRKHIDFDAKVISPFFVNHLETIEDAIASGSRVVFPYIDFLKDEVREIEKVEAGKSRLVSASCLEYIILWRKYFGAFTAAVMETRIRSGMALGFNPITEASSLKSHFGEIKEGAFLAGDFSGFDASQQPQVIEAIAAAMIRWLDPTGCDTRGNAIRKSLVADLVNSIHVNGYDNGLGEFVSTKDILYQWSMSLPSGHPATTVINCIYNLTAFAYAFQELCPGLSFRREVRMIAYGDDNIIKISKAIYEMFSQPQVASVLLRDLGLKYTNECKDGVTSELRALEEVSFLKRSFVVNEFGSTVMALSLLSIDKALCWGGRNDSFEQTVRSQLLELACHPHDVWATYVDSLLESGVTLFGDEPYDASRLDQEVWMRRATQQESKYK